MPKYVLDTNLYIAANRDPTAAEALAGFFAANLPVTFLHATVAQELMLGALDAGGHRQARDAYLRPFETRGRVIVPSYQSWVRSGELVATLIQRGVLSPGRVRGPMAAQKPIGLQCPTRGRLRYSCS